MRVRPTLQPGHEAARMRPEIGTVINVMFSTTTTTTTKVCSCAGPDFGLTRPFSTHSQRTLEFFAARF